MRALVSLVCAVAFFLCSASSGEAQLFRKWTPPCKGVSCPTVIGPSSVSPQAVQHVPVPWLQTSEVEDSVSPRPNIALEPLAGTGSKSPTSLLSPKVTHSVDAATMDAIKALLKQSSEPRPVPISLPMADATSERFSRLLMLLEAVAWLAGGILGISGVGKLGPLVALVANGLRSVLPAQSPAPATPTTAHSSPQVNP